MKYILLIFEELCDDFILIFFFWKSKLNNLLFLIFLVEKFLDKCGFFNPIKTEPLEYKVLKKGNL